MTLTIDRDYLNATLAALIGINSVNPGLAPGAPGEGAIAAYIAGALRSMGLGVEWYEPQPGRPSVVGRLAGAGGGQNLMLNAHTDTVGVGGMDAPFRAEVRAGRMYGRGAQDMKGGLAASLAALKALAEARLPLRGDVLLAAVADEELASLGTASLIDTYGLDSAQVDAAILTEPSDLKICLAHRGFTWLEIETAGRPAHGSDYTLGRDAILAMGRVLGALESLSRELLARPPHPLVGPPSLHTSTIQGGSEWSIYPAACRLQVERRTIPGEDPAQVAQEVSALLEHLKTQDPEFQASLRVNLVRAPHEVAPQAAIVQALGEAARQVLGRDPVYAGHFAWMDSALLGAAGIESVIMGPVGGGLHTPEEWVDLESVALLAATLAEAAIRYCK